MNGRHPSDSSSVGRAGLSHAGQGCQQPVGNGSNWLIDTGFSIDGKALRAAAALTSVYTVSGSIIIFHRL